MKEYIERNALRAELEYDLVEDVNIYDSRTDKEIRDDKYYFAMEVLDNAPVVEVGEIRVPVNGGYLVAGRNSDPDYDGIYIVFETDEGDIIDIVLTECKAEDNKSKVDVYCYEDVYTEDFTRKYTLNNKEIYKALKG